MRSKVTFIFAYTASLFWLGLPVFTQPEHAEIFRGRVEIATTAAGNVQIALAESSGEEISDGIADHLFILQRDDDGLRLWRSLDNATVVFVRNRMTVSGEDFELRLAVASKQKENPNTFPVVFGYGLSHYFGGLESPIEFLAADPYVVEKVPLKIIPDGGGFCDAGGVGATECTIAGCAQDPNGCDITCSDGYYACCDCTENGAECTCEKCCGGPGPW